MEDQPPQNVADELEADASTIDSETEIVNGEDSVFNDLANQQTSIWGLIKTLLSPQTLPHIALIVILSTIFYITANFDNLTTFSAMCFTSITLGYAITAALSNSSFVQRVTKLPSKELQEIDEAQSTNDQIGRIKRIIFSFRICIFPLAISVIAMAGLLALFSDNGALSAFEGTIPLALASLFIIWSIIQGRSFSNWIAAISATQLPQSTAKNGNPKAQSIIHGLAMIFIGFIGVCIFHLLQGDEIVPANILISNLPFLLATIGLHTVAVTLSWRSRVAASRDAAMSAFTWKWTLMAQAFITWHALAIWRQLDLAPITSSGAELLIEEVLLMIFTVFMAIWTLTSRGINSKLPFFNQNSALPWGLAFGYAYAGSVAMLTVVLDDITNVMIAGHFVVVLTILWMQRSVLKKLVGSRDQDIEIRRIAESAIDKKYSDSKDNQEENNERPEAEKNVEEVVDSQEIVETDELVEIVEEDTQQMEENWQDDSTIDWNKQVETISDDIEWNDDVIELDD